MTSDPQTFPFSLPVAAVSAAPLRLLLKPHTTPTGYLDGGWWPRSRDLSAELPAMLRVLATRLGPVGRVSFAMSAWEPVPRRILIDGHVVRLDGFCSQSEHVLDAIGADGQRVSLLVVPPETASLAGQRALRLAAAPANTDAPAQILAAAGALLARVMLHMGASRAVNEGRDDAAAGRWEMDGGRVYQHA